MGVIFEEVVTEVVDPAPANREPDTEPDEAAPRTAEAERRAWQREQADFWRRRARLEAD